MSQMVKKVRNKKEEEIVKENTKNLVGLKEKLLCLSITEFVSQLELRSESETEWERSLLKVDESWVRFVESVRRRVEEKQIRKMARHAEQIGSLNLII